MDGAVRHFRIVQKHNIYLQMGHKEDLARQCNKMEDDANHWRNKVSVKISKIMFNLVRLIE